MDDAVLKAIARWPNVPAVAGWLRLDRRGRWHVKNAATEAFEPISNPRIVEFIGRNYARDERGRWFFQNGPQRVYVALEATPLVYRLNDRRDGFVAQTGAPAGAIHRLLLDPAGELLIDAALGPGIVVDRDLPLVMEQLQMPGGGAIPDERLDAVMAGREPVDVALFGATFSLAPGDLAGIAAAFRFEADPQVD
jgi:hypothetical protein